MYPDIAIKEDKDVKSNFKIAKKSVGAGGPHRQSKMESTGGGRISTSLTGTIMGFHADILIVDDPLNPTQAASDIELANANHFMEQTLPSRKRDKDVTPTILVMQRLNQNDPSGSWLAKEEGNVRHICLPGEIQNFKEFVKPPELARFYVDNLLDTKRISWKVLKDMESKLGQYGYAGQIGQNPTPPGGGMFKVDNIKIVNEMPLPNQIEHIVRAWDKAGTMDGGDYTVGVKMIRLIGGRYFIADVVRGQWSSNERETIIRNTAEKDGTGVEIWQEQEGGPIWEEELIQMADGTKRKLRDVRKNNFIINGNGESTKVLEVHLQGELDTLTITTDSGRIVHAAKNHPFLTPDGWIDAVNLSIGDILALKTNIHVTVNDKLSLEECRLLGYFIGDGCCTLTKDRKNSCNANIVSSDAIEGMDIVHCGESLGFKVYLGGSKGWTYYLSNGVRNWLQERGLRGKNTFTKEVPSWLLKSSKECIANFIGAYFACDGGVSASPKRPYIDFYSSNLGLLKEVQSLLLRFSVYTMLRKQFYTDEFQARRHTSYRLTMRNSDGSMGNFSNRIPVYGVKNVKLKEFKQTKFDQQYLPDPIISIEEGGKLPCRCLSVAKGESFLVNDIVVHNSGGKESAEATIRNLAGFRVYAERSTGDKTYRADPFSVQVNNGSVQMLLGMWNREIVEELRFFPNGLHDDIVDSASLAFNKLVARRIARRVT
jgi:phage terminase large subunit-like protein